MRRNLAERRMMYLLIAVLCGEIGVLCGHMGVFSVTRESVRVGAELAGHVASAQNHLRRRGVDSLIWETATPNEALYYHDAVLTLSQSTATLHLSQDTEVHLSENTLVTIEPPESREHGEIRLKFTKGNLAARNPYHATRIAGEQWSVSVHEGSEIEVRQVGEQNFELQLKRGEANVHAASGESVLKPNELMRVNPKASAKIPVSTELAWTDVPRSKVYTHAERARLPLAWNGHADVLVWQALGQPEQAVALVGEQSYALDLPLGEHRLYLRSQGQSSRPLDVHVWRAPLVQLLRPLPRQRARVDEDVRFVWTAPPGVVKYKLIVHEGEDERVLELGENIARERFQHINDVIWSVIGIDRDGVEIPPAYTFPLYLREDPLAAPKLNPPILRRPASDKAPPERGASWWTWLLPVAYAEDQENFETEFTWESVGGADHYVIEISATPDFRQPVLVKTTYRPRFLWEGFVPDTYYWRVAAGTVSGRLGVFSEPARVDLSAEESIAQKHPTAPARAPASSPPPPAPKARVSTPPPATPAAPTVTPLPAPTAAPNEPEAPPARTPAALLAAPPRRARLIAWQPTALGLTRQVAGDFNARVQGFAVASGRVEVPWRVGANADWLLSVAALRARLEPEGAPGQSALNWQDAHARLLRFTSAWGFGLSTKAGLGLKRASAAELGVESRIGAGPVAAHSWMHGAWQFESIFEVRLERQSSTTFVTGATSQIIRWHIGSRWQLGVGVDGEVGSRGDNAVDIFSLVGLEF